METWWFLGGLIVRLFPYFLLRGKDVQWGGSFRARDYREMLWSKWLFTSTHQDVEEGTTYLTMLAHQDHFTSPVTDIVLRETRTSPVVLALIRAAGGFGKALGMDRGTIWFIINCAIDLAIAAIMYQISKSLRGKTVDVLEQLRVKIWAPREASSLEKSQSQSSTAQEDKRDAQPSEGRLTPTLVPCLVLPSVFYLYHPLSIYKCVSAPNAEALPLLCLALLLRESLKGPSGSLIKIVMYLSLFSAINFSTGILGAIIPIAAALAGTTQTVSRIGEPLSRSEIRTILFDKSLPMSVLFMSLVLLIQLTSLRFAGFSPSIKTIIEVWRRHLNYEMAQRPDAGALWYLVLVMFAQARFVFFTFLNYHLVIHSLPLTLRFGRYIHFLLLFLTATIPLYERTVTLPSIVFSLSLLVMIHPIVGNMRIVWMAIFVQAVAYGLQIFIFDLWLKNDAANINLSYLSAAVPFIMLVIFWLHTLTCVSRMHCLERRHASDDKHDK